MRAYNKKSHTYGFYDKKGKSVTITEDYPEVYEDDGLEFVADSDSGHPNKGSAIDTWSHMLVGTVDGHMAVVVDLPARDRPFVIDANGHQ